jgi:hypothetical protein
MMNDRINILAEQAGFYVSESRLEILTPDSTTDNVTEALREFAELIVRECINEIAYIGKANEVFGDRTDRVGLNHILWTTETAIEKIKQHFGVKE